MQSWTLRCGSNVRFDQPSGRTQRHDSGDRDGRGPRHGRGVCARVADMVDVLLLVDRNEVLLGTQADMLAAAGHRAQLEPFVLDIKDADGIARLAARVAELGPLRAVAHAAGLSPTMADWREILTINLVGTARLVESLPHPGGAGDRRRLLRVRGGVPRPRAGRPGRGRRPRRSAGRRLPPEHPRGARARDRGSRHGLHVEQARGAPAGAPGGRALRPSRRAHLLGHAGDDRHAHGAPGGGGPRHQ